MLERDAGGCETPSAGNSVTTEAATARRKRMILGGGR
jgi:hypothetical protein